MSGQDPVVARIASSIGELPAREWNALDPAGNPFMRHEFLSALEASGSVGGRSGWDPLPILIDGANGELAGAVPAYLKSHSQGEYVFDYAWADAWQRAGGQYYPKLQISAPFTPATGPRLLSADRRLIPTLIAAAEAVVRQNDLSSAHATFVDDEQIEAFGDAGWLIREDIQYHWHNRDYRTFDDFLAHLSSRKRKDIRKERAAAQDGVTIHALSGDDLREEHWDAFWEFYQDTGSRKWGRPYLTREAFSLLGERMGEEILLILAYAGSRPIAGALNFIGPDALYGRYWGCVADKPFLHFELCYYQAIDAAIARGLARVEAGAQGQHKIARGYEPTITRSAHFIPNRGFRDAVSAFLDQERRAIDHDRALLADRTPFRKEAD